MGELTIAGSLSRDELANKMNQSGKTAMLYEATTAVYVTRDNMRELQAMVIDQQLELDNLKIRYEEVHKIAVQYAQAIGEYQAKNDRYRMALLAVVGAGSYEEAERVARVALGPV